MPGCPWLTSSHAGRRCHDVAVSVGNLVGVATRLGHREVDRPDCKPDKKIATPVRGIHAENRPVPEPHRKIQRRPILGGLIC